MPSDDGRAYEVEKCNCGVGYDGLSCEVCTLAYHMYPLTNTRISSISNEFFSQ